MAENLLNSKWPLLALLALGVVSGCCCQAYPLPGEDHCPTDARRLYLSCGEEAVRRCPCGVNREYYGLKPTCWRTWPEGWRCGNVGGGGHMSCGSECCDAPGCDRAEVGIDQSNPFRDDVSQHERQRVSVETLPTPPATSPAATALPAGVAPAPQSHITPPPLSLENSIAPTAPVTPAITPAVPTAPPSPIAPAISPTPYTSPTSTPEPDPLTIAPQPQSVIAPPVPTAPLETIPTQPAPAAPENPAPKSKPMLPPQNFPPKSSAAPPTAPAEQPLVATAVAKYEEAPPKPVEVATKPKPATKAKDSQLSERVEQHLQNNLQF